MGRPDAGSPPRETRGPTRGRTVLLFLCSAALPCASAFGLALNGAPALRRHGIFASRATGRMGGFGLRASTALQEPPNQAEQGAKLRKREQLRAWVNRKLLGRQSEKAVTAQADKQVVGDYWVPNGEELEVVFHNGLGDGTYGQVFKGVVSSGPWKGESVIVKRAKDGKVTPKEDRGEAGEVTCPRRVIGELSDEDKEEIKQISGGYLQVEAEINQVVKEACPTAGAPFLGSCKQGDCTWLVWRDMGELTLEHFLIAASSPGGSLAPLANALLVPDFKDGEAASLKRLATLVAKQLLSISAELEAAGISHRDLKPWNILVCEIENKMRLCDFGSAAAMGRPGRPGFDHDESPCDVRYCPPETFLVEENWAAFDTFSIGLIVLRVLMPALRDEVVFDTWSDEFHAAEHDLDRFLISAVKAAPAALPSMDGAAGMDDMYGRIGRHLMAHPEVSGADTALAGFAAGLAALCSDEEGISLPLLRVLLTKDALERPAPSLALKLMER